MCHHQVLVARQAASAPQSDFTALKTGERLLPSVTAIVNTKRSSPEQVSGYNDHIMNKEIIFLVEEAPEGGYTARALSHSIFTEADNMAELRTAVQDAVRCHFDEAVQDKPDLIRLHVVKDEVLAA